MGRSYTPKYRLEMTGQQTVDGKIQRKQMQRAWSMKSDGRATADNLDTCRSFTNLAQLKGGINERENPIWWTKARLIVQKTGKVKYEVTAPNFEARPDKAPYHLSRERHITKFRNHIS